jgi:glycosyltransferase involved in cell wall biosynthesis
MAGDAGNPVPESGDEHVSVSVVVPVGRVDDDLIQQLDALSRQSYTGSWEIVLSMNTSDDRERARLERVVAERDLPPTLVVDSSDVRSASHARNVGVRNSSGVKLLFCDSDDIADTEWVEQLVAALEFYDAVGGFLDEELLAVPGQEHWRPPATPCALPTFLGHPFLVSANMGIKRTIFDAVGGFDTDLIRGEDIALSWDLLERGIELGYCQSAVIYYRHRRGLGAMMRQHYLYGRGFSQILTRRGTPGHSNGSTGLRALKPNGQAVDRKSIPYVLRRGSIATGRVVGLVEERLLRQSH